MQSQDRDRDEQLIVELRRAWLRHERSALWVVYVLCFLVLIVHIFCLIWGVLY